MGVDMNDCIFCKIARGELHSYKIWENDDFVAFLSLYPETEGMTIVIPKEHIPSYFLEVDDEVVCELMIAAKEVARILDTKLDNVLRTKVVFEGLEIDHLHAKLYPKYRGAVPEHTGANMATEDVLKKIADKINN